MVYKGGLSLEAVTHIRETYKKVRTIEETCRLTNHQYRTVMKYIADLLPPKVLVTDDYINQIYSITGSLDSTAYICNLSRTTIWRRLTKQNIQVGAGATDWKGLYHTLRARVSRSTWRKNILIRDNNKCTVCGDYSVTVHHIKKLSQIRDDVLRSNPEINPFNSHAELRKFSDMVLAEHKEHLGCILCERCHDKEHNPESLRKMEIAITKEAILQWENSTKIIAGTGHRPHKLGKEYDLKGKYSTFLKEEITKAFDFLSPRKIISGMALGFDQLLAIIAIERNIPVIAAIPCDGQEKIWPESSQKLYHEILANPLVTQKIVSDGPYSSKKMGVRNEWMVNNSYAIIAAWDGSGGGTAACLKYAQTIENYLIYRIDPRDTLRK